MSSWQFKLEDADMLEEILRDKFVNEVATALIMVYEECKEIVQKVGGLCVM